jgi:hypothetical protein
MKKSESMNLQIKIFFTTDPDNLPLEFYEN